MKKVLFIAAIAIVAVACKKTYTCTTNGVELEFAKLTSEDAKQFESTCKQGGGTWSSK